MRSSRRAGNQRSCRVDGRRCLAVGKARRHEYGAGVWRNILAAHCRAYRASADRVARAFRCDVAGHRLYGSLFLRDAVLSGGALWPDAREVDARIDWRGPRMHASIEKGRAGSFELSSTKADWDFAASGSRISLDMYLGPLRMLSPGCVRIRSCSRYAPRVQNIEMRGTASLDFNIALPPGVDASTATASDIQAHVTAVLEGARLRLSLECRRWTRCAVL